MDLFLGLVVVGYVLWLLARRLREVPAPEDVVQGVYGYVYVWLDGEGQALYVGLTSRNPLVRGVEHWQDKHWTREAVALQWEPCYSDDAMQARERELIRDLNPVYNKIRYGG